MSLTIPKKIDNLRSQYYKECVVRYGCVICNALGLKARGIIDPHHVDGVGKAGVGGDDRTVGACRLLHHPQSPLAFKELCREKGLDAEQLVIDTQRHFMLDHGYEIPRDGETLADILVKAELGERWNPGKRVSNGTAGSKGKKLPGTRRSTKPCNSFANGVFTVDQ
ncbi:hypothetical protein KGP36_01820 [Patescibacteria group bacterium]|nr:hypothetical protein [Patescibacteria group bacterium]